MCQRNELLFECVQSWSIIGLAAVPCTCKHMQLMQAFKVKEKLPFLHYLSQVRDPGCKAIVFSPWRLALFIHFLSSYLSNSRLVKDG
ncbi:hypothetical protein VNO77_00802 [Canavalia gladiata]|uniref:Uncharacterized protein n=1 Tax=Canavalia gladiata TaxID=3824 RepID=A0AAN9R4E1_CANGL